MKITADKFPVRVDYKVPGKLYNAGNDIDAPFTNAEASSYPFDSQEVAVGETFDSSGHDVVRVVELNGAEQADDGAPGPT